MVRIPIGNERSMRVEVRSVAPDANPYMVHATRSSRPASTATTAKIKNLRQAERYLPDNIYDALDELPQSRSGPRRCWART